MNLNRFAQISIISMLAPFMVQAESAQQTLNAARSELQSDVAAGAAAQRKIDGIDDKTQQLLQDYRATNAEIDQLKLYNKQMTEIVANQNKELAKIAQQIKDIEFTERGILPLMNHMLDSLKQFIQLDLPFLSKERETRLVNLEVLLARADVTVSEKYRRMLEAYQIEIDYGRTLEAYREQDAEQLVFDYLRIGRTALYRVSIDGDQAWLWSKSAQGWQSIESGMMRDVRKALDVARQTAAPELLVLPVPTEADKKGA